MPTSVLRTQPSRSRQLIGLAVSVLLTFAAAALASVASRDAPSFYGALTLPSWAPPGWVFGPVWSVLYTAMAVAAWLVWRERGLVGTGRHGGRGPLLLFAAQLAANALWSWLFFAWRQGALASAEVLLLWALVAATTLAFWRVRPLAGALLLPYLAWVSFACALTIACWRLNPGLLGG
jgi:benzodiazapine receptor